MKNTNKTLANLIKIANGLVKKNKNFNADTQTFLETFVSKFNDELGRNTTPLAILLQGLKNADVKMVSKWIETVTNATVTTNSMGHYTLKFEKENKERNLVYVNGYNTTDESRLQWFMSIEKEKKEASDSYKDSKTAFKTVTNTLEKAINTCKTNAEKEELVALVKAMLNID